MASKLVVFDTNSLARLLTCYSEGAIPLNAEIRNIAQSAFLQSWIALIMESDSWEDTPLSEGRPGYNAQEPYFFRFEAGRVLNLNNRLRDELKWEEAPEAPRRTD